MPLKPVSPLASSVIAVDEGDDATSSTLSFTLDASGTLHASTYAWTCTAVPGAGDPAYPTGTTTGAQTIDTPAAVSTNVTVTGPGRYVFTVTPDGDASKAQTVSVLVSRPLPVISVSGVTSGAGTPGATVTPTISETNSADGPLTYNHAATRGSNGLGLVVTDATSATSSLTYPAQDADGDSVGWVFTVTDAYGRTSKAYRIVDLPGPGNFSASTDLGDYVDTTSPYSFAPTLTIPAGATVVTTVGRISDVSLVSVSDDTTTTPTATCTAADATVGEGFVAKSAVTLGGITKNVYTHIWMEGTGGGGPAWSTLNEVDFTTDISDLTLTLGAGPETLYEADGTTPKASVYLLDRVNPDTQTGEITAAAGGFKLTSSGTNHGCIIAVEWDSTTYGFDTSDKANLYAVDMIVDTLSMPGAGYAVSAGAAPGATAAGEGAMQVQHYKVGASDFRFRSRRYLSGTYAVGADYSGSTSTAERTSLAIRLIIREGRYVQSFIAEGSSYLSANPTPSGSLWAGRNGSTAVAIDGDTPLYTTKIAAMVECLTLGAGGSTVARITKARLQELQNVQ